MGEARGIEFQHSLQDAFGLIHSDMFRKCFQKSDLWLPEYLPSVAQRFPLFELMVNQRSWHRSYRFIPCSGLLSIFVCIRRCHIKFGFMAASVSLNIWVIICCPYGFFVG